MKENTREVSILKRRILEYLEVKGVSKYEYYKNTGITHGVLSQPNGLSEDNLMRFLLYYTDVSKIDHLQSELRAMEKELATFKAQYPESTATHLRV